MLSVVPKFKWSSLPILNAETKSAGPALVLFTLKIRYPILTVCVSTVHSSYLFTTGIHIDRYLLF
jgi:hypothetical protein